MIAWSMAVGDVEVAASRTTTGGGLRDMAPWRPVSAVITRKMWSSSEEAGEDGGDGVATTCGVG